jgi:hypothetical protein
MEESAAAGALFSHGSQRLAFSVLMELLLRLQTGILLNLLWSQIARQQFQGLLPSLRFTLFTERVFIRLKLLLIKTIA